MHKLKILILYSPNDTQTNTVYEHLKSFDLYSRHKIFYVPGTMEANCNLALEYFDVVVFHYSVRLSLTWHLSSHYAKQLKKYQGLKVLFIQDEYDTTETARQWIETLKIDMIFTCVPPEYREIVYPSNRFPWVDFHSTLTGYVPLNEKDIAQYRKELPDRKFMIGYRGRLLNFKYGNLAREKYLIALVMKSKAELCNFKTNIEWDEKYRIYGNDWYKFLGNCRATLGTESGSNIFDDDGSIMAAVTTEIEKNPEISYQEIFEKYLKQHEGKIKMNQISPKIFESITLKTALILFEGKYSNILKPDAHYISLKKDFSNIEEVFAKLQNDAYITAMTEKAYQDIIASEKFHYYKFIENFDALIAEKIKQTKFSSHEIILSHIYESQCNGESIAMHISNNPLRPNDLNELNKVFFKTDSGHGVILLNEDVKIFGKFGTLSVVAKSNYKDHFKKIAKPLWQKLPDGYRRKINRVLKR